MPIKKLVVSFASLLFVINAGLSVASEQLPPHWPWHGVSVNTVSATPSIVAEYLDKLPIKVLRLQLHPCQQAEQSKLSIAVAWELTLEKVPPILREAEKRGVMTVLNVSRFCLGGDQHKADFWTDRDESKRVFGMIDKVMAKTNGFDRSHIAYDFFSEPLVITPLGKRVTPPAWNEYLGQMVNHIRALDKQSWIVVSAGPGMNPSGFRDLRPVKDNKVIYNVHMYLPTQYTHQGIADIPLGVTYPGKIKGAYWDKKKLGEELEVVHDFQERNHVPIWVGEFGAMRWAQGAEQYLKDLVEIFEGHEWGWAYFSGTGFHGWNPNYNSSYSPNQADAQDQIEGDKSLRWQTLRSLFKVQGNNK